ncbi:MAG: hypothetical protein ACYDCC_04910 [Actinomycetota bacterium]
MLFFVVLITIIAVASGSHSSSSTGNAPSAISATGQIVSSEPVDEANLRVFLSITNTGQVAGKINCWVRAYDASGSQVGSDQFESTDPVSPGQSFKGNGVIRIEDLGAYRVREVRAEDCGGAS